MEARQCGSGLAELAAAWLDGSLAGRDLVPGGGSGAFSERRAR
ncbi:hypothetical protein OG562_02855 [Streptomyces sp. NBC_01275]|nr:hypothetical protein [Streptomyces sp. NBC_01275]MCX4759949.1 hypothetical protein [Streptomyces sp. NBC_01275]